MLLGTRRFLPLFITQFLGAFNDNFFKTALVMLIAFSKLDPDFHFGINSDTLVNICAALFILPFFLFSPYAGQIADKFEKSRLIILTKGVELLLAVICVIGFFMNHMVLLLVSLFLLGTQATFFGPLKYSILPQALKDSELLGGNGLIEMGTFIAILMGTIVGGILIGIPHYGIMWISLLMVAVSLTGLIASFFIPKAPALDPNLHIDPNPFRQIAILTRSIYHQPALFYAVIGISWFWFFGSIILTQIPNFTRIILAGSEQVATLILTSFSVGIGVGSVLCEWLSHKKIEIGFTFIGLAGITLFTLDFSLTSSTSALAFLNQTHTQALSNPLSNPFTAIEFISTPMHWRILIDGFLMGAFGGLYLVPLYTLIQKISIAAQRSRVIAINNILNAIFMVIASIFAIIVLNLGFSIPELFVFTAIFNGLMGYFLYKLKLYL